MPSKEESKQGTASKAQEKAKGDREAEGSKGRVTAVQRALQPKPVGCQGKLPKLKGASKT